MRYGSAVVVQGRLGKERKFLDGAKNNTNNYRSVKIASLGNRRRGKHHDLIGGILQQLHTLQAGRALEIPLGEVGGVELANLRSAVHRAATADNFEVETQSDERNFYVWLRQKA
jgi:hypothetical protein